MGICVSNKMPEKISEKISEKMLEQLNIIIISAPDLENAIDQYLDDSYYFENNNYYK
jgi:hypothetical protein